MKYFEPDYKFSSMENLNMELLKKDGVEAVILDIDNTLVEPHTPVADERAKKFVARLKENGFKICIVSNNIPERAGKFADSLELDWVCDGNKPARKPFLIALDKLKTPATNVAVIGDQVFTDVWGAKRMKMKSVLLTPICDKEGKFVKFKRKLEKIVISQEV